MSVGALASMAGNGVLKAAKLANFGVDLLKKPFKPLSDINKEKYNNWVRKKAAGASDDKSSKDDSKSSSGADNNESAKYGSKDNAKNAINGDGFKRSFGGGNTDNTNNNDMNNKKNTVGDAIKNNGNSLNKSNENNQNNQSNDPQQGEGGNK
jgi:hypothetical protein